MSGRVQGPPRARPAGAAPTFSWPLFLFTLGCALILVALTKPLCELGIWALRAIGVIP